MSDPDGPSQDSDGSPPESPQPVPPTSDPSTTLVVPPVGDGEQLEPVAKRHWSALTALIVGIVSAVLSLVPALGFFAVAVLAPLTIIFAIIAILKTRAGQFTGRKMAIIGLALAIVSIIIAIVWLVLINLSLSRSFDSLYGSKAVTEGPGRNEASALSFGSTSDYPNGMKVTATSPVTVETPQDQIDMGFSVTWKSTITFTNGGSEPVQVQPIGRGSVVEAGQTKECVVINGAPLSAVESKAKLLVPGEASSVEGVFTCRSSDPLGVVTIQLAARPDPYDSTAFFRGPLDGGQPPGQ